MLLHKLLNSLSNCDFIKTIYSTIIQYNIQNFNQLDKIIDQEYLDFIVYEYIKRNPNTFIVIVWPICVQGDDIIREHYNKDGKIIYYKEIILDENGHNNFLKYISDKDGHKSGVDLWFAKPHSMTNPLRIYIIETYPTKLEVPIKDVKNYLVKVFNNNKNYIDKVERKGLNVLKNLYITTRNKKKCRIALHNARKVQRVLKETPPFEYSHHINDLYHETIEIGKVVLNNNTLRLMQHFSWGKLRRFNKKFRRFQVFLKKHRIDTDKVLIYNSGILAPFGLREPSDIDFLQLNKHLIQQNKLPNDVDIQNKYFPRGYMILQTKQKAQYMEDQPRFIEFLEIDDPKIIWKLSLNDIVFNPKNYYYYDGIKFMEPNLFKKVKRIRGRPKDLEQLKILNKSGI